MPSRLRRNPHTRSGVGKRAFYQQLEQDLAGAYEYTAAVMVKNLLAADAGEGIDAFLEKRKPGMAGVSGKS